MSFLLIYILKVSVSLAVVFLFYQLVLQRLTFYNWNRIYLLGYSLFSFFIPFIDISGTLQQNRLADSEVINWMPVFRINDSVIESEPGFSFWDSISFLLLTGFCIMTIRLVVQLFSFKRMMKKAMIISDGVVKLYQVNEKIIPFSFGNAVFINKNLHSDEELQEIIRHEIVHVKQRHSIDIVCSELLCIFNWFNPFAWLIRKAIRQNLEFIADNKVLDNGIDRKQYQYLLLKVIGNNHFSIAPKFNFSSLKKRIAMMNKLKSTKVNLLRFLFVLPLFAVILLSFRKQLGDTANQKYLPDISREAVITDTVPEVTSPNAKGYIINVKDKNGECELVIKDKKGNEVKRLLLTEWNEDEEKYMALYGKIPPPPPPAPPAPPTPPAKVDLPENVQRISVNNKVAFVWLKNGDKERYDLNDNNAKQVFESKYGKLPPPPPPVPAVAPVPPVPPVAPIEIGEKLKGVVKKFEITDTKAVMHLNNGTVEKYDLTDKESKQKFEDKYGDIIPSSSKSSESLLTVVDKLNKNYEIVDASEWNGKNNNNMNAVLSVNNKSPLIVLDGKVISQEKMAKLDKEKIESIDVLKDKSATTLYGEKGKNGVLIIRTKDKTGNPLIILDGKIITKSEMDNLSPHSIESINVLKGKKATDLYQEKGKDGVIVITSKKIKG